MLYMPKTRFAQSQNRTLAPGSALLDEGIALVAAPGGTVKAGTGLAAEKFVGFSVNQRGNLLTMPRIENVVATSANYVHKLNSTPLGGTLTVRNSVTNAVLVASTDYTLNVATNEVTLVDSGISVSISYEYSPTVLEARAIQGDVQPGGTVPVNYQFTGVISKGDVYTSWFETADDWTNPNAVIRVGANGKLTTQGTGAVVDGYVIGVPSSEQTFLGICLR